MSQARSKRSRGEQLVGQRRDPGGRRKELLAQREQVRALGRPKISVAPGRGRSGARARDRPRPGATTRQHDAIVKAPAADEDAPARAGGRLS